jgi:general secretion pathway protein A
MKANGQMAWEKLGYNENPFDRRPDERFLFEFGQHRSALADLEYTVRTAGFAVFSGDIGSGKTAVMRSLLNSLDIAAIAPCFVRVRDNSTTGYSIMQDMVERLGEEPPEWGRQRVGRQLERILVRLHEEELSPLLIIDEAQELGREALTSIRLMSDYQLGQAGIISIILIGQPELRHRLLSAQWKNLAQRVTVWTEIHGLTKTETDKYVRHRLATAGGPPDLFSANAIEEVYTRTEGVPRKVNRLCEDCMTFAVPNGVKQITRDFVDAVADRHPFFQRRVKV